MCICQLDLIKMKKISWILFCLVSLSSFGQMVGTPYGQPSLVTTPLDLITNTPSFAFSTRKLRSGYSGYAIRVRRSPDNSEVDVAFDANNIVSNTSTVTFAVTGTSGQTIGTTTTLSAYLGAARLYASLWYDQSGNARNAIQATAANQPELILNSQNGLAVLVFDGTKNIPVTTTAPSILGTTAGGVTGIVGTLFFTSKITISGNNPESLGFKSATNVRFQMHLNWNDGNAYFDAGGVCCGSTRLFSNAVNVNYWKQYTMQRQDVTKIGRVSGVEKMNGAGETASAPSISNFGIGATNNITTGGHVGHIGDFILYNIALASDQMRILENNQISFWNCN